MKIKLYIDEDAMDSDLAEGLHIRGVDVLTANQAGMIRIPDENHLEYATSQGRVLYSFNIGDYQRIHTQYLVNGPIRE
jgi:hypothetical protein